MEQCKSDAEYEFSNYFKRIDGGVQDAYYNGARNLQIHRCSKRRVPVVRCVANKFTIGEHMKLKDAFNPLLGAGLSRIWQQVQQHDIATISAFRGVNEHCATKQTDVPEGNSYTKQQNLSRNKQLKAKLLSYGYGVTAIDGSYIENFNSSAADARREVRENSFFVVNLKDDPSFKSNLVELAKMFCQDSVLLKEDDGYYLHGTNNSDFPGFGQKEKVGDKFDAGVEREFMSRIRNRPFAFESKNVKLVDVVENIHSTKFYNINSIRLIKETAKKVRCCK